MQFTEFDFLYFQISSQARCVDLKNVLKSCVALLDEKFTLIEKIGNLRSIANTENGSIIQFTEKVFRTREKLVVFLE